MDTPNAATRQTDSFGGSIVDNAVTNAPLDANYLESLFAADPDQVTEIEDKPQDQPAPKEKKEAPSQPAAESATEQPQESSFIANDDDFISNLDNKTGVPNAATPSKNKPQQPDGGSKTTGDAPENEVPTDPAAESSFLNSQLAPFTKELFDIGLLTVDEGEDADAISIKSAEDLVSRLNHEKKKGAVGILENILSNFGQEYRDAFDAIYMNGVHPRDYFTQVDQIESLAELDLTKAENQRLVLRKHYKTLGWDNNKIQAKIEKLENYQDLEEEAKDIHEALILKEKQALHDKEQETKAELARKASMDNEYQTAIQRILTDKLKSREFDGIPLDENTTRQLSAYMLQKKWQLGTQQISDFEKEILDLSRPENRELQTKVALLLHLLKKDPTLTRLQRKAVTQQTNKVFSFLQREDSTAKKQGRKPQLFFED